MFATAALGLRPSTVALVAFVLAFAAGLIHLLAGMQHIEETPVVGWGMLITALAQFAGGAFLLVWPSMRWARALFVGTVLAFAIFAVQYTAEILGFGPGQPAVTALIQVGRHEHSHVTLQMPGLGTLALANFITELALIIVLLPLVLQPSRKNKGRTPVDVVRLPDTNSKAAA